MSFFEGSRREYFFIVYDNCVGAGSLFPIPSVLAFLRVRVAGLMELREPNGNPLLAAEGEALEAAAGVEGAEGVLEGDVVVMGEDGATAVTTFMEEFVDVEAVAGDELLVVVVVVVVEGVDVRDGGGASGLVAWATLDETLLPELEGSVPDEGAAIAPRGKQLVSDQVSMDVL